MTYCLGIVTKHGLVMASDSRTNAGTDQASICRKMFTFEIPGKRALVLLTSGSLSLSQSVLSLLQADFDKGEGLARVDSMYEAARAIGTQVRKVREVDCDPLEKDGYHFDTGPSLFTQPQNIEELFELAAEPIDKYLSYQKIDIACKYFYENGKTVQAYTNAAQFAQELQMQVNEVPANVTTYLKHAEKLYENIGTVFLNHSLHKRRTWLNKRIGRALSSVRLNYLTKSLHRYNVKKFTSPETVQIFDRFATYNGSDPYKAPSMLSMIPHLEQNQGTFYPRGGMISITNAIGLDETVSCFRRRYYS